MARRVFFSFHYQRDIFRANVVRNSGVVEGYSAAGFQDASIWEEAKTHGPDAVHRLVDRGLEGTSVTAVLIGARTASRQYVDYEIEQSIKRGNGLLGIHIHLISIPTPDTIGLIPWRLTDAKAPVYYWDRDKFGQWVEEAYQRANTPQPPSRSLLGEALLGYDSPPPPGSLSSGVLSQWIRDQGYWKK